MSVTKKAYGTALWTQQTNASYRKSMHKTNKWFRTEKLYGSHIHLLSLGVKGDPFEVSKLRQGMDSHAENAWKPNYSGKEIS